MYTGARMSSNSLFPDDVRATRAPKTNRTKGRRQHRRKAWEDHVWPQVYATDLADPHAGTVAVTPVELKDPDAILAAVRERRVAEYARRYDLQIPLHHPADYTTRPDYARAIEALGRMYREEMLAAEGLRFLAKGVYPVRDPKIDPQTPWRAQPWLPAQPASPNRPAKPGRHVNIVGKGKGKERSTHIVSEDEAWKALLTWYRKREGIEVDVHPPPDSIMAALFGFIREAHAAAANERSDEGDGD